MARQIARSRVAICFAALCLPFSAAAEGTDDTPYVRDLVPEIRELVAVGDDMEGRASGLSGAARQVAEESGNITVRETDESVVLSVTSDVLFGFDSAELSDKAKSTLADIIKVLDSAPQSAVRVVGHTDSKGSDSYNRDLSEARADSVVDFLVGNGVEPSRLRPEGRGESEPVAPNEIDSQDNPDGRAQNRRVEFVLPKE
jgi:outer membrane protein OmpA-like peptidoglycan-associated protein